MGFLRVVIGIIMIYILARMLGRWIFKEEKAGGEKRREKKDGYSNLTDQAIEDADFEEIETEDK